MSVESLMMWGGEVVAKFQWHNLMLSGTLPWDPSCGSCVGAKQGPRPAAEHHTAKGRAAQGLAPESTVGNGSNIMGT